MLGRNLLSSFLISGCKCLVLCSNNKGGFYFPDCMYMVQDHRLQVVSARFEVSDFSVITHVTGARF